MRDGRTWDYIPHFFRNSHVPLPEDRVLFEPSWQATPQRLVERARPGDVVLTLGAGDVTLVGPEVLELLAERFRGAED